MENSKDIIFKNAISLLRKAELFGNVILEIKCGDTLFYETIRNDQFFSHFKYLEIIYTADGSMIRYQNQQVFSCNSKDQKVISEHLKELLGSEKISAIVMFDCFAIRSDLDYILNLAKEITEENKIPLVISADNAANRNVILKLLQGKSACIEENLNSKLPDCRYTRDSLEYLLSNYGFEILNSNDVKISQYDQRKFSDKDILMGEVSINQYLTWFENFANPDADICQFIQLLYADNKKEKTEESDKSIPFLSIVMRTQGKRPQALAEALLCLTAQSDLDFEVLIIGHNLDTDRFNLVSDIISETPYWFREKIRYISAFGGNRTLPLQRGFQEARGEYITAFDDDDLVLDHWVETFHEMANKYPGRLLHSYAVGQNWRAVKTSKGMDALEAYGSPQVQFCKKFNPVDQLIVNNCPFLSIAFPAYLYQKLNLHFDDTLSTAEDWDYLMRSLFICGVAEKEEVTCVYRLWENIESSLTLHNKEEWKYNYKQILQKFNKIPILLPEGTPKRVFQHTVQGIRLYYQTDEDAKTDVAFTEDCTINPIVINEETEWSYIYKISNKIGKIKSIRYDPNDIGCITVNENANPPAMLVRIE